MNKGYIKRQLNLRELGFEINEDVEKYDSLFKEIIDVEHLTKSTNSIIFSDFELWFNNSDKTIYYDNTNHRIHIDSVIWIKYHYVVNLIESDTNILMISLFEHYLNIEISNLEKY